MKAIPFDQIDAGQWNALCDVSPWAWLWHRHEFVRAKSLWHDHDDHSFGIVDEHGALVALVPLHRIRSKIARVFSYDLLSNFGGIAVLPGADLKSVRAFALTHLQELAGKMSIRLVETLMAPTTPVLQSLRYSPLEECGFTDTSTHSWVVNLSAGDDDFLLRQMNDRTRRSIKKAEKAGVVVRAAGSGDSQVYYDLHRKTCSRTGADAHPASYFDSIFADFLPQGLCAIFFAERDGAVVSAVNYASYKRASYYWTGASTDDALDVGASHLLHWHAMKDAKGRGDVLCDTGEAFFNTDNPKYASLSDFKRGFGGDIWPYYKGTIDRRPAWMKHYQLFRGAA